MSMTRRMLPSARESRGAAHAHVRASTHHERNPNMFLVPLPVLCVSISGSQFELDLSIYAIGIRYFSLA